MRKTLFFAFALAASVLAFVACDKKDKQKEEPTVDSPNPILGTWFASDIENDYFYTFNSDGSYQRVMDYYMNGRAVVAHEHIVGDGSYTFENDIVTTKLDTIRISMDGSPFGPFPDFWPAQEKMKFKVEGDKLTLTHDYESGDAWTEVLTQNGKPADQDDPSDINIDPAKLVNTEWRTDSCFMNGERTAPPHLYIRILSEDAVIMNGENHNFVINKNKMTCTYFDGTTFTIVETQPGWAHVKGDNGSDVYLSKLPEKDIESMIMEHQASDFYGTWKLAYFTYNNNNPGYEMQREGTNPGTETWEFKADGSCIYYNWLQDETVTGSWECNPYQIIFSKNPAEGIVIEAGEAITVQPLTPNWMCILRSPDGYQYYYWWFYRVK